MNQKFQYRVFEATPHDVELILNELAAEGWQIACVGPASDTTKMAVVVARVKALDPRGDVIDIPVVQGESDYAPLFGS